MLYSCGQAMAAMLSCTFLVFNNALQQASIVAPVVITSSTSNTCLFSNKEQSVTSKEREVFLKRSVLLLLVCVFAEAVRDQDFFFIRTFEIFCHFLAKQGQLVVAPFFELFWMKWNWKDQVDVFKSIAFQKLSGQKSSHKNTNVLAVLVF